MLKSTKRRLSNATSFISRKKQLVSEVKRHAGWRGEVSLCEAADLLKGNTPSICSYLNATDEEFCSK